MRSPESTLEGGRSIRPVPQAGSVLLLALGILALITLSSYAVDMILQTRGNYVASIKAVNARDLIAYELRRSTYTPQALYSTVLASMQSPATQTANLNFLKCYLSDFDPDPNQPANNPQFPNCQAYDPADPTKTLISYDMYLYAQGFGGSQPTLVAGTRADPVYYDNIGQICPPGNTSQCPFKAVASFTASCPPPLQTGGPNINEYNFYGLSPGAYGPGPNQCHDAPPPPTAPDQEVPQGTPACPRAHMMNVSFQVITRQQGLDPAYSGPNYLLKAVTGTWPIILIPLDTQTWAFAAPLSKSDADRTNRDCGPGANNSNSGNGGGGRGHGGGSL